MVVKTYYYMMYFCLLVLEVQSGKVEYERERLAGNRKKLISHIDSQQAFRARIRLFRSARGQLN